MVHPLFSLRLLVLGWLGQEGTNSPNHLLALLLVIPLGYCHITLYSKPLQTLGLPGPALFSCSQSAGLLWVTWLQELWLGWAGLLGDGWIWICVFALWPRLKGSCYPGKSLLMAKTEEQEDNPTAWVCMTSVHNPLTTASHSWAQSQGTGKRVLSMEIEGVNSLEQPAISVQSLSHVQLFAAPWIAAHEASLSITNSRNLLKLMSITSVMPSNHLILCRSLLLLPSIFPIIRVFSNESALLIRWPKYWSFSYSISPSNEYSGLISFRMDWLDLLGVQGTLKSLLQHHSSKASILPLPPLTTPHHQPFNLLPSVHEHGPSHTPA